MATIPTLPKSADKDIIPTDPTSWAKSFLKSNGDKDFTPQHHGYPDGYQALREGKHGILRPELDGVCDRITDLVKRLPEKERKAFFTTHSAAGVTHQGTREALDAQIAKLEDIFDRAVTYQAHLHPVTGSWFDRAELKVNALNSIESSLKFLGR